MAQPTVIFSDLGRRRFDLTVNNVAGPFLLGFRFACTLLNKGRDGKVTGRAETLARAKANKIVAVSEIDAEIHARALVKEIRDACLLQNR